MGVRECSEEKSKDPILKLQFLGPEVGPLLFSLLPLVHRFTGKRLVDTSLPRLEVPSPVGFGSRGKTPMVEIGRFDRMWGKDHRRRTLGRVQTSSYLTPIRPLSWKTKDLDVPRFSPFAHFLLRNIYGFLS